MAFRVCNVACRILQPNQFCTHVGRGHIYVFELLAQSRAKLLASLYRHCVCQSGSLLSTRIGLQHERFTLSTALLPMHHDICNVLRNWILAHVVQHAARVRVCARRNTCRVKCWHHRFATRRTCINIRPEWLCQRGTGERLTRSILDKSRSAVFPCMRGRLETTAAAVPACLSDAR